MKPDDDDLIRPSIRGLTPYSPGKPISEVQRELGLTDIIKLASNENPLGPSPAALRAMQEALEEVRLYPDNDSYELREAVSKRLGFPPEQVVVGRGSDEVIHMIGLAFLRPGEESIMPEPPFTLYEFTTQLMGGVQVRVPLRDFTYDLPAMAERFSEKTKLVFFANPNNPTGTMVRKDAVAKFMSELPPQAIMVFDEAYREYVDDPEYPDGLDYVREGANALVLRTFSKVYALAGLRIGYGVGPPHLMKWLQNVREPFNVSSVAQAGALASLDDEDQVKRAAEANREGKKYLYAEFERMGLRYVPTQANFIFVDAGKDSRAVFSQLLRRGVIVRTGDIFGFPTFVRVTIGTPEQNERFIRALEEVLKAL